jgi:hypothetical protein
MKRKGYENTWDDHGGRKTDNPEEVSPKLDLVR